MPQELIISDDDILYAQSVLLDEGKTFDAERIAYIKNLGTLDLQAVPGSGKTTCLLAKLLILERKLPFEDGSGILVLSHTNAAIDEIRAKVQDHCPKLFDFPNHIGTIQSFVDRFLAKPIYNYLFNNKLSWIDKQGYDEDLTFHFRNNIWNKEFVHLRKYLYSRHITRAEREANGDKRATRNLVTMYSENEIRRMYYDFSRNEIWYQPENAGPRKCLLKDSSGEVYKQLKQILLDVLRRGVVSFDSAFYLAEHYVRRFPAVQQIIQKRFSYVFVDEMQDMSQLQYDLLEGLFFDAGTSSTIFQRIGDRNQSIYNHVQADDVWEDRAVVFRLSGSHRLSKPIANVIQPFALYNDDWFEIKGLNKSEIKPLILVFDEKSVQNVIPYFGKLIKQHGIEDGGAPIKVICWNTQWPDDDEVSRTDPYKLRLEDYHGAFRKGNIRRKQDYDCLKSYLIFYEKKNLMKPLRDNILSALVKVLRLEQIDACDGRPYTNVKLVDALRDLGNETFDELNRNLFSWSLDIVRGKTDDVCNEIRAYVPKFLENFSVFTQLKSRSFLENDISGVTAEAAKVLKVNNRFDYEGVEIEVGSVHSVKGQTHRATLYLESYYYNDGGTSYESQRLAGQFLGEKLEYKKLRQRVKQSAKMAFVGFSRPTDLLCVAIHRDRVATISDQMQKVGWEVTEVPI